jgi:nucleotide-binding universal stress UspA family protein
MKILLAVDDSPHSQEAVREAAARPWPPASVVRVLSAVPPYVLPATEMALVVDAFARIHEERLLSARDLTERMTARRRLVRIHCPCGPQSGREPTSESYPSAPRANS